MPNLATGLNSDFITDSQKQGKNPSASVQDVSTFTVGERCWLAAGCMCRGATNLQAVLWKIGMVCGAGVLLLEITGRFCWEQGNWQWGATTPKGLAACLVGAAVASCPGCLLCSRDAAFACPCPAEPEQDEGSSCVSSQRRVCPKPCLAFSFPAG